MIVLDASATVELLLRTPTGTRVAARIADLAVSLHAPHLLDAEVAQVLRRYEATGVVAERECASAFDDLVALDIERHAHVDLLGRVWALRHNLTAYDACYVALAEALPAPLLTCDRRIGRASGHRAEIISP